MESSPTLPTRSPEGADPWESVIAGILPGLLERLRALGHPVNAADLAGQIDRPTGIPADLAFPVHRFAKASKEDPATLAGKIAQDLPTGPEIARVEASAGFVNFHADPAWLARAT